MRTETAKRIPGLVYAAAICVFVACLIAQTAVGAVNMSFSDDDAYLRKIEDGWTASALYSDHVEDLGETKLPVGFSVPGSEELILKGTLPDDMPDGSSIAYNSAYQIVRVYVDGKLFDSFEGGGGILATSLPYGRRRIVDAGEGFAGKPIEIHYSSRLETFKGSAGSIYVGDRTAIIYRLMSVSAFPVVTGIIMVTAGLLLLFVELILRVRKQSGRIYVGIAVLLIAAGSWLFMEPGTGLVIIDDVAATNFLELISLMFIPIPALYLLDQSIRQRYHNSTVFIAAADLIFCLFALFMSLVFKYDLMDFLPVTNIFLIITVIYYVITIVLVFKTDRALFQEMRWMTAGYLCVIIGGGMEILMFFVSRRLENGTALSIGFLGFMVCSIVWAKKRVKEDSGRLQKETAEAAQKKAFLANTSHEIRTPINAILGMSELILRETADEKVRTYADDLRSAGRKLLVLINNILDYSRITSGKMQVFSDEFSVERLLNDIAGAGTERNPLTLTVDRTVPSRLKGDREKIIHIVEEIILNCLDSSDGQRTAVYCRFNEGQDPRLFFSVRCTGRVLTSEELEIISDPLSHAETGKGMLLGLTVSDMTASLMGGSMKVSQEPGEAVFSVLIPVETVFGAEPLDYHPASELNAHGIPALSGIKILAADDADMNLKLVSAFLKDTGAEADLVTSGVEAVTLSTEKKYDILLLDSLMPQMNGVETLKSIRSVRGGLNADTPAIIMTADNSPENAMMYRAAGFAECFYKPYSGAALIAMLSGYVDREGAAK